MYQTNPRGGTCMYLVTTQFLLRIALHAITNTRLYITLKCGRIPGICHNFCNSQLYMEKLMNEENEWDHGISGLTGLTAEMVQATEGIGTQWLLDLCNGIVKDGCIPEDSKSSVILPIYKGKGDPMECGSYRGIKLLENAMKVVERIFEHRIRQQIEVDDMQFGFIKGKGTTDAISTLRQMQENFSVKGKKLYFGFVDLEKTFDRVPREVIRWAMRKL